MHSATHRQHTKVQERGGIPSLWLRSAATLCIALLLTLLSSSAHGAAMLVGGSTQQGMPGVNASETAVSSAVMHPDGWRLKIKDAAVVQGERVLLGEIAEPIGPMPPALWQKLSGEALWASPPKGRPMNMTRPKIQQAMAHHARELSSLCLYPASMTLQQGGAVLTSEDLRAVAVKTLTPHARNLGGEAHMQDFRLPTSMFLTERDQAVVLEGPYNLTPGRNSLRFAVVDPGGTAVRRSTGTMFLDVWASVPCAGTPLNKDEVLGPDRVQYARKNLAHIKGEIWDGRGGPWRMQRPVPLGQPILQTDVAVVPTVRKGAPVTMVYESKNVMLSIPGEALSDGAHGESVVVRNLQTKKQLRGIVRDAMTVVVR
jgi:flagella basal body P-ring formation protein FlgA